MAFARVLAALLGRTALGGAVGGVVFDALPDQIRRQLAMVRVTSCDGDPARGGVGRHILHSLDVNVRAAPIGDTEVYLPVHIVHSTST